MAAADGMAETALLTLKERIVACRYRPGARLSPERLARDLNIGVTPMRVALALLHNDGFIEHESRTGYFVRTPSAADLRGLYLASKFLAAGAAGCALSAAPATIETARSAVAGARPARADVSVQASRLFDAVAILAQSDIVARTVSVANARLRIARKIEATVFTDTPEELSSLSAALTRKRFAELRTGVERYHDRRLASVEQIADAVFMQAFRLSEK